MTPYEITFIIRPDLDEEQTRAATDGVSSRLEGAGAEIMASYAWTPARRRMAFPIREFGDGYYFTSIFQIDPPSLRDFENSLKLNDNVLRFLIVQATEANIRQSQGRMQQAAAAAAQPAPSAAPITPPAAPATTSVANTPTAEPVSSTEESTAAPEESEVAPAPDTVEAVSEVAEAQETENVTPDEPNEEAARTSSRPEPVATATTRVSTEGEE